MLLNYVWGLKELAKKRDVITAQLVDAVYVCRDLCRLRGHHLCRAVLLSLNRHGVVHLIVEPLMMQ